MTTITLTTRMVLPMLMENRLSSQTEKMSSPPAEP
jgi:hypothetical protein